MKTIKTWFKSLFKGWNTFEYIFFCTALTLVPALGIIFKSSIFEIIASTGGSAATIMYAKGKITGYFMSLVVMAFEVVAAWQVELFGTVVIIFASAYPMVIFGIFSWAKKRRKDAEKGEVVVVSQMSNKETAIIFSVLPVLGVGIYFMLQAFGTRYLIISTLSTLANMTAIYLLARRSRFSFFGYCMGDIFGMVLWIILLSEGHTGAVAMIALNSLFLISDVYGIFEWRRLKNQQGRTVQK